MASPMPWVLPVTMMILSFRRIGKRIQKSEFRIQKPPQPARSRASPNPLASPPSTGARGEEEESQSCSGRIWELPADVDDAAGEEERAAAADHAAGEECEAAVVGTVVGAVAVIVVAAAAIGVGVA